MARTLNEISQSIISQVTGSPDLSLTNTSSMAVWVKFANIVAFCAWTLEKLWDVFKSDINEIIDASIVGSTLWYRTKALQFRIGENIGFIDGVYKYADTVDGLPSNAEIIKRASAEEVAGVVQIKVAKETDGNPLPLSTDEKSAFSAYMNKIKFAGVYLEIISREADHFSLSTDTIINYNPEILTSIGESIANPGVFPVDVAINEFSKNIDWNGRFYRQKLINAIQAVKGVLDVTMGNIYVAKAGCAETVLTDRYYQPDSGYIVYWDTEITYQLD